jgi:hypothetical protein
MKLAVPSFKSLWMTPITVTRFPEAKGRSYPAASIRIEGHACLRPLATALLMGSALLFLVVRRQYRRTDVGKFQNHFNSYDLQVVATAAGQLATAVESAGLLAQTDDSLRRRVDQLSAITRISRELSVSLDFKQLLQIIHDESLRAVQADCSSVLLFDPDSNPADPKIGFCGQRMGANYHL